MGLRNTVASAVASAFTALDDIPEAVTYRRTTSVYDPQTGTNVTTDSDITVNMVFTSYKNLEIDRVTVLTTDVKGIVQQADMGDISPSMATDTVVRGDETFNVLFYSQDPTSSIYTIQLRKP